MTLAKLCAAAMLLSEILLAQTPHEGDFKIADFQFSSGEHLAALNIHYMTFGEPRRDPSGQVANAVLIMHGTGGSGKQFLQPQFRDVLFGAGQLLDTSKYFIILPDDIGHGGSSKPSDGMHAHFPRYGYSDMVEAEHRLVTEGLHVNHLRLVMGTSMGCMHSWMWGERYPDAEDALMPLACLPVPIAGRNRIWRKMVSDAIRNDPQWQGGNYDSQPQGLLTALRMIAIGSGSTRQLYLQAPTMEATDRLLDRMVQQRLAQADANDLLYAWDASRDYDPVPGLERIRAQVLAINFADDQRNPPELGVLEREIARVPRGRFAMIPASERTRGHASLADAALWKDYLVELLARLAR